MGKVQGIIKGNKAERELNFSGKLYLPEIFKGMWFTFSQMFRKSVTLEYPEVKPVMGPEFRGRPVLVAEEGKERCVACGLCARACPPLAISMQAAEITDDQKERYPERFEIDMLRCIYCGFCEEVCPEEAIVMSPEYDYNFQDRKDAIYGKDKLVVDKELLKPRLDFLEDRRNRNFGKVYDFEESNNIHTLRNRDEVMKHAPHDEEHH
ncbi:MAG: NADH-quinone oxidoreductase subunit I [Bacteroidetes bacterium]|nr:MAG: NADH-quinone oxidoreductase subunit I [Bacteroidota bacterium]